LRRNEQIQDDDFARRPIACEGRGCGRRWADGTTHLVFEPTEFLSPLAVLVPRPRINLLLYYGGLGARAAWRRDSVPPRREAEEAFARAEAVSEAESAMDSAVVVLF
jgi:hypothetical protein